MDQPEPLLNTPLKRKVGLLVALALVSAFYLLFAEQGHWNVRARMLKVVATDDTPVYDWELGDPAEAGLNATALDLLADEWGKDERVHSLLIARGGKLYFEKYFNGWTAEMANPTRSIGKLWVTTLAGVAEQNGHIDSLDTPVSTVLPDAYSDLSVDDKRRDVTFQDLMTMRSGYRYSDERMSKVFRTDDWLKDVVGGRQTGRRGEQFFYSTSQTHLLSGALTGAVGEPLLTFASRELCEPLGISIRAWSTDPSGIHFGGSDMKVRPRDLMRLGELYQNDGVIDGKRILSESFIKDSYVYRRSTSGNKVGFGYSWWLYRLPNERIRMAYGRGGQTLTLYPKSGFMVVTTCGVSDQGVPRSKLEKLLTKDLPQILYPKLMAANEPER